MAYGVFLLFLHVAGVVVWVGGMFTMLHVLRPAAHAVLAPPQRVPLMTDAIGRFLRVVWVAMPVTVASGFARLAQTGFADAPRAWHWMAATGLAMAVVFAVLWFGPFATMRRHAGAQRWPEAAAAGEQVRRLVATNL